MYYYDVKKLNTVFLFFWEHLNNYIHLIVIKYGFFTPKYFNYNVVNCFHPTLTQNPQCGKQVDIKALYF